MVMVLVQTSSSAAFVILLAEAPLLLVVLLLVVVVGLAPIKKALEGAVRRLLSRALARTTATTLLYAVAVVALS
jgi:uncharacterized BrkB/YihY/UPF0761 family membrane protein